MKTQLIILFFIPILLLNCTMKSQQNPFNEKEYQELHKHKGTDNYELIKIVSENNLAKYQQLDTISKKIVLKSYYKSENKKENTYETLKVTSFGEKIVFGKTNTILKDGTMWNDVYYRNWIINGDKTTHKYLDPFTNNEISDTYEHVVKEENKKKWLEKFIIFYNKASYVYKSSWSYYMKINNIWYYFQPNKKIVNHEFVEQYPNKEDQEIRMVALKDLSPSFGVPPEKRDSTLLKEIKYKSERFEKSDRGSGFNFSAGWWYLEVYMPQGDTIKIKRYADFRKPLLQLHKIPKEHGGSNEILFIIQKPEQDFLEKQVGGMYVIRPRNYKELP